MAKVRITQVRSTIKKPAVQKATMVALGLGKINYYVEHELNPQLKGMLNRVQHLVTVTEL
jgi:large subunit ribosomal protein L30